MKKDRECILKLIKYKVDRIAEKGNTECKYGRPTIFCLDRFSRKEKQLNNDKDSVKISHYVHFQGHILILGEVIGNQILGKT